jgi:phosphate transport system substrate-binding protein
MLKSFYAVLSVALILASSFPSAMAANDAAPILLDPNLPIYRPQQRLEGQLKLGGSNTMSHVAAVWADSFKQFYPEVKISIDIFGSRKAVESVRSGAVNFGLLSRSMSRDEGDQFVSARGYPPTVLTPCLERTAVYAHKDNPIQGLTFAQVDAIYSTTRQRGAPKSIGTWGEAGASGSLASQRITAHGRSRDTGSQVFFQEAIMLGGQIRNDLKEHKSNIDMLKALASDPTGIAFGGMSYATPAVKAVPLAFAQGQPYVAIDSPEADRGMYPLVRRLQLVVNRNPKQKLSTLETEFIKYAFSRQGQEDVVKAGFQAIPAPPARVALDAIGLGVAR